MSLKRIFYIILNITMFAIIIGSLMIYTSLDQRVPWYEPCGMQGLAILTICAPMLFGVFSGFIMLKILEYKITNMNIILPVITLTGMVAPMWICEIPKISVYFGIIVCILSIIKMIFDIKKNFKLQNDVKQKMLGQ